MFFFNSFWVFHSPSYFIRILRLLLFFHLIIFFHRFIFMFCFSFLNSFLISHFLCFSCFLFIFSFYSVIGKWLNVTLSVCLLISLLFGLLQVIYAMHLIFFSSAYLFVVIFSYYSNLYSISFFFPFVLCFAFLSSMKGFVNPSVCPLPVLYNQFIYHVSEISDCIALHCILEDTSLAC